MLVIISNTPFTRYNRLSNTFDSRFDNRLCRVNGALALFANLILNPATDVMMYHYTVVFYPSGAYRAARSGHHSHSAGWTTAKFRGQAVDWTLQADARDHALQPAAVCRPPQQRDSCYRQRHRQIPELASDLYSSVMIKLNCK